MKLVKHLLDAKGRNVISISADASVFDAIKMMADESIGSLVVLDENGGLAGIVTERDYARKVIVKGRSSRDTRVADIMTADVLTTSCDNTVNSCMEVMSEKKLRHLPVVEDGAMIGLISIGDVVKARLSELAMEKNALEGMIMGH